MLHPLQMPVLQVGVVDLVQLAEQVVDGHKQEEALEANPEKAGRNGVGRGGEGGRGIREVGSSCFVGGE